MNGKCWRCGEGGGGAHASLQHDGVEFLWENAATAPNMSGFCPSTCLLSYPPLSLTGYYIYYIGLTLDWMRRGLEEVKKHGLSSQRWTFRLRCLVGEKGPLGNMAWMKDALKGRMGDLHSSMTLIVFCCLISPYGHVFD